MKKVLQRLFHSPIITLILLILLLTSSSYAQVIRYVDASKSPGPNQTGTSWANAYPTLKEALDAANANTNITEIRVAKGTYYPTGDQSGTDRNAAFGIYRRNLAILGGYPTGGGSRNWDANPTILSGEINDINSRNDNSYHVVVVAGQLLPESGNLMIEGFRIHWGRADGGSSENSYNGQGVKRNAGGGIAIVGQGYANWLVVRSCIVSGNYAGDIGAGVYIRNTNMKLLGSLISGNYANYVGGVFVHNTDYIQYRQEITNCTIVGNHSNIDAGGLRLSGSTTNVQLVNTVIFYNTGGVRGDEYISIKDDASYLDYGCIFQWRNNSSTYFSKVISPGTATIEGEYWPLYDHGALINSGQDNVYDLGDFDLKYNPRRACLLDIGAYEYRRHPIITEQPQPKSICSFGSTSFSVSLGDVGATFMEWQERKAGSNTFHTIYDSHIYSGTNTSTLTLTSVPYDHQTPTSPVYNGSTFRCVMWNEQCAKVYSEEVVLTVRQPMHVTGIPKSQLICIGKSVTFSTDALNGTGYQWEYDDGTGFKDVPATSTYSGRTTKNLTINSVTAQMNNYLFRAKVSSLCSGTKTSETAKLTVPALISISQQPVAQTVCIGSNTSFSVQGSESNYQWQYHDGSSWKDITHGSNYSNFKTKTLDIISVTSQMNGYKYRVKVDNGCDNSVISQDVVLHVNSIPSISTQPLTQTVCYSNETNLSVQASNVASYQWQYKEYWSGFQDIPEGNTYSGVTTERLRINKNAPNLNILEYRVVLKSTNNCELISNSARFLVMTDSFTKGISTLASTASTATVYQFPMSTTWYSADCNNLILSVVSSGNEPLQGITHSKTWIAPIEGFVQRRYEITPENNASTATGRITLYFTQADFDAYNKPDKPMLPTNGNDTKGIANLRIQKRSGTSTDNSGLPESYDPGTITEINPLDTDIVWNEVQSRWEVTFEVTGFSGFFVYAVEDTPLPVTLVDFKAHEREQNVHISWRTSSEENSSHFEVERSGNGNTWQMISRVNAMGDGIRDYQYADTSPLSFINYYRLKMIDLDNSYSYSKIISVHRNETGTQIKATLYPNPVSSGHLIVNFSGSEIPHISVFDLLGRKTNVQILKSTEGKIELNVSQLTAGIYIMSIRKENEEEQILRFVVH